MKIVVTAFACDPGAGSEPGIGFHFVTSLAEAGHDVWCLTTPKARDRIERAHYSMPAIRNKLHFTYLYPPIFGRRPYSNMIEMYAYYILWQRRVSEIASKLDRTSILAFATI